MELSDLHEIAEQTRPEGFDETTKRRILLERDCTCDFLALALEADSISFDDIPLIKRSGDNLFQSLGRNKSQNGAGFEGFCHERGVRRLLEVDGEFPLRFQHSHE